MQVEYSGGVGVGGGVEDEDMDTMDETMAAMVLTNLSCSPQSPTFPSHLFERGGEYACVRACV